MLLIRPGQMDALSQARIAQFVESVALWLSEVTPISLGRFRRRGGRIVAAAHSLAAVQAFTLTEGLSGSASKDRCHAG